MVVEAALPDQMARLQNQLPQVAAAMAHANEVDEAPLYGRQKEPTERRTSSSLTETGSMSLDKLSHAGQHTSTAFSATLERHVCRPKKKKCALRQ